MSAASEKVLKIKDSFPDDPGPDLELVARQDKAGGISLELRAAGSRPIGSYYIDYFDNRVQALMYDPDEVEDEPIARVTLVADVRNAAADSSKKNTWTGQTNTTTGTNEENAE